MSEAPAAAEPEMQADFDAAIARLRRAGTDLETIEAKSASRALPKTVVETLSAFSNTRGGLLLLGVDEARGFAPVEGIDAVKLAADLASAAEAQMEPPLSPRIDIVAHGGSAAVIAQIDALEASRRPCYVGVRGLSRGVFRRTHDGDRRLTTYEVHVLQAGRGQPVFDREIVPGATDEHLDPMLVNALLSRIRDTRPAVFGSLGDAEILSRLRVRIDDDGIPAITLGGLLALGTYPQEFFPQLDVTFVSFVTTTGESTETGQRFFDNRSVDGPIPVMVAETLSVMKRNMKRRAFITGAGREDRSEYPEEAIRELIANALIHRDYHPSARGTSVSVRQYPDRVEVSSPGGLHGAVSLDDLTTSGMSSSRNSHLAKLLEDVEVPGTRRTVCENRGSGLVDAMAALRKAGIEEWEFIDTVSAFRVRIGNEGLLDPSSLSWLASLGTAGLEREQHLALAYVRRHGEISNGRLREISGRDSAAVTRLLSQLAARGLLEKVGEGRWTTWRMGDASGRPDLFTDPEDATRAGATTRTRKDRGADVMACLADGPVTARHIAERLRFSRQSALNWLNRLEREGEVKTTAANRRSRENRWALSSWHGGIEGEDGT